MNLDAISPQERLLVKAYKNLLVFGRAFLPGDFLKKPPGAYQQVVADEINSDSQKPCAIILPRKHIKTVLIKCSIIHDLCYHKQAIGFFAQNATTSELREFWEEESEKRTERFYAWVAKSQSDSMDNVKYVSKHLSLNSKIAHYFGGGGNLQGPIWNREDITTKFNDRLLSLSNLKSLRGKTEASIDYGALRFYRVLCDDFENEHNTKTWQSREDLKKTLLASIIPAVEIDMSGARMFVVGTPVHGDSFIQNILDEWNKIKDSPEKVKKYPWVVLSWRATQPNLPGGVLWEGGMPRSALDKARAEMELHDKIALYYQEYELEVQSDEERRWTRKHIKFWKGHYLHENGRNYLVIDGNKILVNIFLGSDPATDIDTESADYNVVMVIAVDEQTNVYVLEYESHKSIPVLALRDEQKRIVDKEGIIDIYVRFYNEYHAEAGRVEDVAMTRSVFQSFNSERSRVGSFIYDRWDIKVASEKPAGKGSKLSRIYGRLNGKFSAGKIYYRENMHDLVHQTVQFGPRLGHDDIIETLDIACVGAYPPKNIPKTETVEADRYTGIWKPKLVRERRARQWQV